MKNVKSINQMHNSETNLLGSNHLIYAFLLDIYSHGNLFSLFSELLAILISYLTFKIINCFSIFIWYYCTLETQIKINNNMKELL